MGGGRQISTRPRRLREGDTSGWAGHIEAAAKSTKRGLRQTGSSVTKVLVAQRFQPPGGTKVCAQRAQNGGNQSANHSAPNATVSPHGALVPDPPDQALRGGGMQSSPRKYDENTPPLSLLYTILLLFNIYVLIILLTSVQLVISKTGVSACVQIRVSHMLSVCARTRAHTHTLLIRKRAWTGRACSKAFLSLGLGSECPRRPTSEPQTRDRLTHQCS